MVEQLPTSIAKHPVGEITTHSADALVLDQIPEDTMAVARLLNPAAAGSVTILEFKEMDRKLSEWREVFQALGFRVLKLHRETRTLSAVLHKSVPSASSKKRTILMPRVREENTFERLYEWIGFLQRFDAIADSEIILVEDVPLTGNDRMMQNIVREGFFLRKTHFRPFGLSRALATGFHFSAGRKIIVDSDPTIPADEIQSLLETSFPLDMDGSPFLVSGIRKDPSTDLKRSRRFCKTGNGNSSGWKKRMRFALLTDDAA